MSKRQHAPVRSGDIVDVTIDRLAQGGRGVARHEGFVLFVGRALPGEHVRARVTRVKRSFAEAMTEELLAPGPDTVEPGCDPECGACSWQRLSYPAQLRLKEELVRDAIVRIGGVEEPPMHPIIGADETTGYRNKVEYTFTKDEETREVTSGYHRPGKWDEIVAIETCQLADPRTAAAKRVVDAWANTHDIDVYDREAGTGLLRTVTIRVGYATGELLVHVLTGPVKDSLYKSAELIDDLEAEVPGLVGVLHSQTDSPANVSIGDNPPTVLWGRDWYMEEMGGKQLKVRSQSFTQTNTAMANKLYERVLDVAQLREDDTAYDLYCGLGSITLAIAPHVHEVVGVEVVEEAIDCARENAELNDVENIEWQVGNVRPILKFAKGVWPDPTLIVVDPPRAGLAPKVVRRICEAGPERIVYVSCNPTTFAGNLPMFREHGYAPVYVQPVDQFPHTSHCELVARLEPIEGWTAPAEADIVYGRAKPDGRARKADAAAAFARDEAGDAPAE
ncbi:MAG: 23S rRNA (uracil(1939)-C(5))-methyltransferase RlmD [Gaiellales bacterium]